MRVLRAGLPLLVAVSVAASVNPRLKDVHKIYVGFLRSVGSEHGKVVTMAFGSPDEVQTKLVEAIAKSGRFAVVTDKSKADVRVDGTAGYVKSEKDGKKYTTGYAHLELIDPKSTEVIWTFDYARQPGVTGSAAERVANQFVEKLLADAKTADGQ